MNQKQMWFALSKIPGMNSYYSERIVKNIGDIEAVFRMKKSELQRTAELLRMPERIIEPLLIVREFDYSEEYEKLRQHGIQFITREDAEYPNRFRTIPSAPYYLYYKGKLPSEEQPSLAVIGARNCSVYGQEIAHCFSKILAGCGIQIISGMARGIDGQAHKGALDAGGYTCGVLGFGMDICYPKEHTGLKKELETIGGMITEYAMGTPGIAHNFPARNRLIAGISDAVLVIEAAKKSGTLITVECALEQGKMIYAVPGRIGDRLSEGCNEIIKDGGRMVTEPEDVLDGFQLKLREDAQKDPKQKNKIVLERQEKIVYACLDLEPKHIEQLIWITKLPQDELLVLLMRLEMMGYIRQPIKNYFVKNINCG